MGREQRLKHKRHQARMEYQTTVASGSPEQVREAKRKLLGAEIALNDFRFARQPQEELRSTGSVVLFHPNDSWRDYKGWLRENLFKYGTQLPKPGQDAAVWHGVGHRQLRH